KAFILCQNIVRQLDDTPATLLATHDPSRAHSVPMLERVRRVTLVITMVIMLRMVRGNTAHPSASACGTHLFHLQFRDSELVTATHGYLPCATGRAWRDQ